LSYTKENFVVYKKLRNFISYISVYMCTEEGNIIKRLQYNRFRKVHTQNEFYTI